MKDCNNDYSSKEIENNGNNKGVTIFDHSFFIGTKEKNTLKIAKNNLPYFVND